MLGFLKKVFGSKYDRDVKAIMPIVEQTKLEYSKLQTLSNDELRQKTQEFRDRIKTYLSDIDSGIAEAQKEADESDDLFAKDDLYKEIDALKKEKDKAVEEILEQLMPEAFAVVKETARRFTENDSVTVTATQTDKDLAVSREHMNIEGDKVTYYTSWKAAGVDVEWNMIHYDVQLIGGVVLHKGKIAEMQTGEGKTLVATLPAYLNGLTGMGVHVITVNDYLAKRDCEWMAPLFQFLGLSIDCIDNYRPHSPERKQAYLNDITYGTNNEFGFDYLRDNMVRTLDEKVQGKYHFAMIDEVDSVLVDEARTPLIISGPVPKDNQIDQYKSLKSHVERLLEAQRKVVTGFLSEAKKLIAAGNTGYNEGEGGLALLRAYRGAPKSRAMTKFMSEPGNKNIMLKAEAFYMQENSKNMHICDEPLYFTIEEKNRAVELIERGNDLLSKASSDPGFFILPDIGSEIVEIDNSDRSDEEKTIAKEELMKDYGAKSERLHSIHQLVKAYTMFHKEEEYVVMDGQVKIVDEQTGRIMEGRRYSDGLHQAIEAKENVKIENSTQTYATVTLQNFFRMYHKLSGMTGTAETESQELWEIYKLDVVAIPTNRPVVRDDKNDLVYKTEKEKYNAIIDEIIKLQQAGRPILVGTTSVQISELLSRLLTLRNIKHNVLNAKQHQREAEIVAEAGKSGVVTIATNMAGRGTDIKLTDEVKKAGGLAIIGTERHDSRRVDRQLRGRSGRQGDPGSSQFFVSLEDKLMRLFGSDRIAKLMDRMGHKEGDVISHGMVSKSIERAQKKVEENNFGIRKRLLEYDDVMNIQREAIYDLRNNALSGDRLSVDLNDMFFSLSEGLVSNYKGGDFDAFKLELFKVFGIDPPFEAGTFASTSVDQLTNDLHQAVMKHYSGKFDRMVNAILPIVKQVYKDQGSQYRNIAIPFDDGIRMMETTANLEEAVNTDGKSMVKAIEKSIALALIDSSWKEHLRTMDDLKDSVQAASFEQKDPLVVYKREAYHVFEELINTVNHEVASFLFRGDVHLNRSEDVQKGREAKTDSSKYQTNKSEEAAAKAAAASAGSKQKTPVTYKRETKKVGRNEPCPCGSGKKYKQCHGKT